jgi:hypothetical protein
MLSAWVNGLLKYTFDIPRPADPRIRILWPDPAPSFPSGHAQNAVAGWGYMAYRLRSRLFWVVAFVFVLCIGLSRLVVGVHYPHDVLAGWIIGLILLVVYARAEPAVGRWIDRQRMVVQLVLSVVAPLILIFLHPADGNGLYPAERAITTMSALTGLGIGVVMEREWVRFRVEGIWWRRVLRFLVGLIVVGIAYAGPRLILPEGMPHVLDSALRFGRYALLGWMMAVFCPWLFVRLRLSEQDRS